MYFYFRSCGEPELRHMYVHLQLFGQLYAEGRSRRSASNKLLHGFFCSFVHLLELPVSFEFLSNKMCIFRKKAIRYSPVVGNLFSLRVKLIHQFPADVVAHLNHIRHLCVANE